MFLAANSVAGGMSNRQALDFLSGSCKLFKGIRTEVFAVLPTEVRRFLGSLGPKVFSLALHHIEEVRLLGLERELIRASRLAEDAEPELPASQPSLRVRRFAARQSSPERS